MPRISGVRMDCRGIPRRERSGSCQRRYAGRYCPRKRDGQARPLVAQLGSRLGRCRCSLPLRARSLATKLQASTNWRGSSSALCENPSLNRAKERRARKVGPVLVLWRAERPQYMSKLGSDVAHLAQTVRHRRGRRGRGPAGRGDRRPMSGRWRPRLRSWQPKQSIEPHPAGSRSPGVFWFSGVTPRRGDQVPAAIVTGCVGYDSSVAWQGREAQGVAACRIAWAVVDRIPRRFPLSS